MGRCGYSRQEKKKKGNNLKYNNTHTLNNNEQKRQRESNGMIYPKYQLEGINSEFCVVIVFHQRQNHCTKRQKKMRTELTAMPYLIC